MENEGCKTPDHAVIFLHESRHDHFHRRGSCAAAAPRGKNSDRLGHSPAEAVRMLLAQIELRNGLAFDVGMTPKPLLTADEQTAAWTEAFGAILIPFHG